MIFIRKNIKLLLVIVGFLGSLILGLILNRRGKRVIEVPSPPDLTNELRAITAEANAARDRAELGAERARMIVEAEHVEILQKLDDAQRKEAEELRNNPERLAGFLIRSGKQGRK